MTENEVRPNLDDLVRIADRGLELIGRGKACVTKDLIVVWSENGTVESMFATYDRIRGLRCHVAIDHRRATDLADLADYIQYVKEEGEE